MANITFFLRGTSKNSSIYFRYRPNKDFDLTIRTPYSIDAKYWDKQNECYNLDFYIKSAKDETQKSLNTSILTFNNSLSTFRSDFTTFILNSENTTKEQIREYVKTKYFPEVEKPKKKTIPENVVKFIEYYIEEKGKRIEGKQEPITASTAKRITTIKNRIADYNNRLTLLDIDDDFRDAYTMDMQKENYKSSYIIKDLKYLKTISVFASKKKMEINTEVLHWEFLKPKEVAKPPILSFAEIDKIQKTIYGKEHLENAKDWLVIGFYTGARVSDLLNFDAKNIIDDDLLRFQQKKIENQTDDNEEIIYLPPEVIKILEKRDGEFPRKISDVKFNEHIKEVCRLAGLTQKMFGAIKDKTKGQRGKKITGEFEKWELVTSHICRRSFVTNFIGILGKHTKNQTGHKSEQMVSLYDKTEKIEKALQVKELMQSHLKIV